MKALFLALSAIAFTSLIPLRAADSTPAASVATVTITAPDPTASEDGPSTGLFTFHRTGATINPLTVSYRTTGTAVGGADYVTLPGTVTIPTGASSASLLVTPIADKLAENAETVIVTLSSPGLALTLGSAVALPTYTIGDPSSATVTIKDSIQGRGPLPTVSIVATAPNAAEPSKSGAITISRIGSLSNALQVVYDIVMDPLANSLTTGDFLVLNTNGTVNVFPSLSTNLAGPIIIFDPSGKTNAVFQLSPGFVIVANSIPAATPGVDYKTLPGTATIPAGRESVKIEIVPIDDKQVEGTEHVTLKLKPSPLYSINPPDTATVYIADDDPVNQPPVVKMSAPGNGQSFPAMTDITVTAAASDPDGSVLRVEFFANGKSLGVKTNNPASASPVNPFQVTWKKVPAGQYTLTAKATDNRGAVTTAAAVHVSVVQPVEGDSLIPLGAVWKYWDKGTGPGAGWQTVGFDDSQWASGPAQFGFGEGDEATVVSSGADAKHKHITTYFRHAFDVADPTRYTNLTERILREDGAIAYLNGTEVSHGNMPSGTVTNETLAVSALSETTLHSANVDPKLLIKGVNVMAVEVHLASPASSEMSFDFDFTGRAIQPAPISRDSVQSNDAAGVSLNLASFGASVVKVRTDTSELWLSFRVDPGHAYQIQGSPDMTHWTDVKTVDDANGVILLVVPTPDADYQFYRAIPAQ